MKVLASIAASFIIIIVLVVLLPFWLMSVAYYSCVFFEISCKFWKDVCKEIREALRDRQN